MQSNVLSNGEKQYTMFDLTTFNNIFYWENVISSPNELVGFIEELELTPESYERISSWQPWTASNDSTIEYGYIKNAPSKFEHIKIENRRVEQKTRYIINSIKMAIEMCSERYVKDHGLNIDNYKLDTDMLRIRKWHTGQHMGPHADGQDGEYNLAFTIVLYLNDQYENGEIEFPNHNISIKPKSGSLVMFPATSEYIHLVKPIISGNRYSISSSLLMV